MPVKKKSRNIKKTKVDKKVKQEIKEAVDKIPGLIVEHLKFSEPLPKEIDNDLPEYLLEQQTKTDKERIISDYRGQKKGKQLLWIGVGILALIVFGMWGWNTMVMFGDFDKAKTKEAVLFKNTGMEIGELLKKSEEENTAGKLNQIKKEETLNNLKQSLTAMLGAQLVSTTPSTTAQFPTSSEKVTNTTSIP